MAPPPYTAETTGNTFFLNLTFTSHADAELNCQANGGHLAQYASADEQKEVEQYFTGRGLLFPVYHQSYWIGLAATDSEWLQLALLPSVPLCLRSRWHQLSHSMLPHCPDPRRGELGAAEAASPS